MSRSLENADNYSNSVVDANILGAKAGRKNLLINGGFDVWQRGEAVAVLPYGAITSADYTADGFIVFGTGGAGTISVAKNTLTYNGQKISGLRFDNDVSTNTAIFIGQYIEGKFGGKTATFSCLFSNATGAPDVIPKLTVYKANARSVVDTKIVDKADIGTVTGDGTIYRVTYSFDIPVDTTDYDSLFTVLELPARDYSTHILATSQWQIEIGTQATDFEYRPYAEELSSCKRFLRVFGSGTGIDQIASGIVKNSTETDIQLLFDEMRVPPTISFSALGDFQLSNGLIASLPTSITPNFTSKQSTLLNVSVSGGHGYTVGYPVRLELTASGVGKIYLSSEL